MVTELDSPKTKRKAMPKYIHMFDTIFGFHVEPREVVAKDGSGMKYMPEHRVGPNAGAFTRAEMWKKGKFEKEYFDRTISLEKKFTDAALKLELANTIEGGLQRRLGGYIRQYKQYLAKFYRDQALVPMMAFVPLAIKGDNCFYLQGFYNAKTLKPVIGDVKDWALWTEAQAAWTRPIAETYDTTVAVAKMILKLPHLNKDIQNRLGMVVSGTMDRTALLEHLKNPKGD